MNIQIKITTKHSPIRKNHTPNIRYKKNNNEQINQSAEPSPTTTIIPVTNLPTTGTVSKKQKSVPLSKTHMNTKTQ